MAIIPILTLAILEEEDRRTIRNRIKRPKRINAFDLPENEFVRLYKINKEICAELVEKLRPALEPRSYQRTAFSVEAKVLCALRLYAGGLYQKSLANDILTSMSQQSVSNCLRSVTDAINNLILNEVVQFPVLESDRNKVKEEFFNYSGFPGVIGAIDCIHVSIIAPPDDGKHHANNYVNQEGYHSLSVQLVSDVHMKILSVCARFPGSTDDEYIWNMSGLRKWFDINSAALKDSWLLGDSGYPLEPWLMTPIAGSSDLEQKYNDAHERGHSVVKRCSEILKSRFKCLLGRRPLKYSPSIAASIVNACVVLHNMCLSKGLQFTDEKIEVDEPFNTGISNHVTKDANIIRKRLIRFFDS